MAGAVTVKVKVRKLVPVCGITVAAAAVKVTVFPGPVTAVHAPPGPVYASNTNPAGSVSTTVMVSVFRVSAPPLFVTVMV